MIMKKLIFVLSLVLGAVFLKAQDARLAQQYYQNGEFEKAAVLYDKLYAKTKSSYYFDRYVESLLGQEDYDRCISVIKKQLKKEPQNVSLYVSYGKVYDQLGEPEKGAEQYKTAIDNLPKDQYAVTQLASSFMRLSKYEEAAATYEKGAKLLKDQYIFSLNLGELYRRKGDMSKMIDSYLNSLLVGPERSSQIRTYFQRYLSEDDFLELQEKLYERIQENEGSIQYVEMLTWVFIQRKDYKNAFRQVKALDRRLEENGGRIFQLARVAANDGDYETSIQAYDYIVEQKGLASTFYIDAKREGLMVRRDKLVDGDSYTMEELRALEGQYEQFLEEFGSTTATASIVLELAEFEAFYINDIDKAITLLSGLVEYRGIDRVLLANAKVSLGDFYLMKGDRWESTLLYSQVDKEFKEGVLGHEARYRNAKLSYFFKDFEWAQSQFNVLKASTSKLIANDALDLSVFIMDNLGLDSTATALEMYAEADLLVFQNKFEEAFVGLDNLLEQFPEHTLDDDVLYLKAQVFKKQHEWEKAAETLQYIFDNYKEDIRADNALFELGELYETHLNDLEKAKTLYETLFIDFSNSTFAVDARKRYRKLRGDDVR
jgi:tetratricopeptide (TPR) repeat protein